MTSASVKDLGSLITFVNPAMKQSSQNGKADISFGEMMSKSQNGQMSTDIGSLKAQQKNLNKIDNESKGAKVSEKRPERSAEKARKEIETEKPGKPDELTDEVKESFEEAGRKIEGEVAKELDVSTEEVREAMEILGLNEISLLDPTNLNQLVLELSEEIDPMALVTNEELFNTVKELTTIVDAIIGDLAEDMDIEIPKLEELIEQAEVQNNSENLLHGGEGIQSNVGMEMSVEADSELNKKENAPEFSVTVDKEGESIKIETDSKGNEMQTLEVTKEVTGNEKTDDSETRNESKASKDSDDNSRLTSQEQGIHTKAPEFENLVNKTNEEIPVQTETPFVSQETKDIMNQIMDYMKLNVKQGVSELEMQLHPASLGNVKINLIAKGGEVTAEFKVQNEAVKAAMEAQISELKENFKESGTKVTAIEVSVDTQSFDSNLWQGKERESNMGERSEQRRTRKINLNDLDALFEEEASEEEILAARMLEATGSTVDFTA